MSGGLGFGTALHATAMLGVVVGLIAAMGWALRRWGITLGSNGIAGSKAAARYRISQRLVLSQNHTLIELETPQGPCVLVLGPQGATELSFPQKSAVSPTSLPSPRPRGKK